MGRRFAINHFAERQERLRPMARLGSLTKPFLNWADKAERQQISLPTLPGFVHDLEFVENLLYNQRASADQKHYGTHFLWNFYVRRR
jgi:hypothetical protein